MSWLSHFTNWVGEKSKTILPIVTGVAGFAAGMIPGIGGTVSKLVDKIGGKISGGVETLQGVSSQLGIGPDDNPALPTSLPLLNVAPAPNPTATVADISTGTQQDSPRTVKPATSASNTPLLIGGGLLAFLLLGGSRR